MTDATVYVPTYGRTDRQITWRSLAGTQWAAAGQVMLVAPEEDAADLRRQGMPVLVCPAKGIGPTRQWIMDQHDTTLDGAHVFMMDDDLKFFSRRFDDPSKFTPVTEPIDLILDRLLLMLEQVPLVGLANRSGANRLEPPIKMYGRMHDLQCVHVPTARKIGARFDRIRFMEDFDVALQFLTQGYPTALLTTHCKDDMGASNAPGGCSSYRTLEGQAQAALDLYESFPEYVRLTKRPGWRGDMQGSRTDVVVQWAKAYRGTGPEPDWTGLAPEWEIF